MQTTTAGLDLPQPELWLPTGQASRLLGCSPDTLKRYIKRDGFLIEGEHWYQGPHSQSPIVWNIHACRDAIKRQGRLKQRRRNA